MKAIRRGWFHLASGAAIGRIFGFASNVLLSRWLGPSDLGIFNLVTTTVQTSDTLVRCGGDYALNYELGCQPDAAQTERGSQLVQAFAQICSLATAFVCCVVTFWIWFGQGLFPASLISSQRFTLTILLLLMIVCEGISASAWEVFLVRHQTSRLALRQGFFMPLRLFSAAICSFYGGVLWALVAVSICAVMQLAWLSRALRDIWKPFSILPVLTRSIAYLLKSGFLFYASNLLSSLIFYLMLMKVATNSGLEDVGYLRVGQILQQLFAFLPATLVPVLFLKMRSSDSFAIQTKMIESPIRLIWLLLIQALFLYCLFDSLIIDLVFGAKFATATLATRFLIYTALLESLVQLLTQPILATGKTGFYSILQNISAVLAGATGIFCISTQGLSGYLFARMLYPALPFCFLIVRLFPHFKVSHKLTPLLIQTAVYGLLLVTHSTYITLYSWTPYLSVFVLSFNCIAYQQDIRSLFAVVFKKSDLPLQP